MAAGWKNTAGGALCTPLLLDVGAAITGGNFRVWGSWRLTPSPPEGSLRFRASRLVRAVRGSSGSRAHAPPAFFWLSTRRTSISCLRISTCFSRSFSSGRLSSSQVTCHGARVEPQVRSERSGGHLGSLANRSWRFCTSGLALIHIRWQFSALDPYYGKDNRSWGTYPGL
jgi:hypothetical protein